METKEASGVERDRAEKRTPLWLEGVRSLVVDVKRRAVMERSEYDYAASSGEAWGTAQGLAFVLGEACDEIERLRDALQYLHDTPWTRGSSFHDAGSLGKEVMRLAADALAGRPLVSDPPEDLS